MIIKLAFRYFLAAAAQAAILASELASIEPLLLEPLQNGKPGAVCTLYESKSAFSIVVECAALPPVVVLSMVALGDFIPALPVVQGRADDYRAWRVIGVIPRTDRERC
jgi:hypothetical protein